MISEDLIKMLEGCLEHFVTFSDFFRRYLKTSEDFQRQTKISGDYRRFPRIFKNFKYLSVCLFFALSGVFS